MTTASVHVYYDNCRFTLFLPRYFAEMPLAKIRKLFRLLAARADRNGDSFDRLDRFFPEWAETVGAEVTRCENELASARMDAEQKRQTLAALGSAVDERIADMQNRLSCAKAKRNAKAISVYRAALAAAKRPKTECERAVRTVETLTRKAKRMNGELKRVEKIIAAYNEIQR